MNKRIISIVIALSMCLVLFPLPAAATGTAVAAAYAEGMVTVSGTGFTKGVSYTVRIVDTENSSVKAMGQVSADGSGGISAAITTGELTVPANYKVYINNPDGTIAASSASLGQITNAKAVTLNRTTATIGVHGSMTLIATVQPSNATNKNVVWTSSNTAIATVTNGVVTGVTPGTAVITVTTVDGGFTATCSITIIANNSGNDDSDRDTDNSSIPSKPATPTPTPTPVESSSPAITGNQRVTVGVAPSAIRVTLSSHSAMVTVEPEAIAAAAQAAQQQAIGTNAVAVIAISPQLQEDVREAVVQLAGSSIAGLAQGNVSLQINTRGASILLSPEVLGGLPAVGDINLTIKSTDPKTELGALPKGMTPVGGGIQLQIGPSTSTITGNISIEILLGTDVNRDLVGLYYLEESTGELKFISGRMQGDILQGETTYHSKYFVMVYSKQYNDTVPNSWYSKYVDSMTAKHIMMGYQGDVFNGSHDMTRGEFAAALVRALDFKPVTYEGKFEDVNAKDYFAEAIQSLYNRGVMTGDGKTLFSPETAITREEIFAIIGRVIEVNTVDRGELKHFTDVGELSEWSVDGAAKAVGEKIILGDGDRLNPTSRLSRYEAAAILYRLYNR